MTTLVTTPMLSKPTGRDKISGSTLSYMQTRNRMRVFTLVHAELKKSGLTKAELADRIGKGADRIAHLLGAPGNWTLDTVSDLLFAISGAEVDYKTSYPLDKKPRNQNRPDWLYLDQKGSPKPESIVPTMKIPAVGVGGGNIPKFLSFGYISSRDEKPKIEKVLT